MEQNRYSIDQSPLFKLSSKKKLAELLHSTPKRLKILATQQNRYKEFYNKKIRKFMHRCMN